MDMRKSTKYSSFIIAALLATTPILVSQKVKASTDTSSESSVASKGPKVNQEDNSNNPGTKSKSADGNGSSDAGLNEDDDDDSDGTTQSGAIKTALV